MNKILFSVLLILQLGVGELLGFALRYEAKSQNMTRDVSTAAAAYIRVYNNGAYAARYDVSFNLYGQRLTHSTGVNFHKAFL
jgi:hypothetical protein